MSEFRLRWYFARWEILLLSPAWLWGTILERFSKMAHRIAEKQTELAPLRVLPRGVAMVTDYAALLARGGGVRRFHGRKFDPTAGGDILDDNGDPTGDTQGGFVTLQDEPVVIPARSKYRAEYIRHLREGDLWAADEETAKAAGVPFEPDFGGEHPGYSKKEHCQNALAAIKERAARGKAEAEALEKAAAEKLKAAAAPAAVQTPKASA